MRGESCSQARSRMQPAEDRPCLSSRPRLLSAPDSPHSSSSSRDMVKAIHRSLLTWSWRSSKCISATIGPTCSVTITVVLPSGFRRVGVEGPGYGLICAREGGIVCGASRRAATMPVCDSAQRAGRHRAYSPSMTFDYKKLTLAAAWILVVLAAALFTSVGSPMAWFVVSIVALAPCLIMLHFWQVTPQTISQSIHEARR